MEKHRNHVIRADTVPQDRRPAWLLALGSSALATLLGAVYFVGMVVCALEGKMTMPPPDDVQLFGGIMTAAAALMLPVVFVSVHYLVPERNRVFSLLAVVFCVLFSAFVGINRFVQLSVVRLSILEGGTEGLARFLPYGGRSVMFALEITGWGMFMSLATLFLALALGGKGTKKAVRIFFFAYVPFGLISAIAFMLDSPLSIVGFVAWGFLLFVGTALLACSLANYDKHWAGGQ